MGYVAGGHRHATNAFVEAFRATFEKLTNNAAERSPEWPKNASGRGSSAQQARRANTLISISLDRAP